MADATMSEMLRTLRPFFLTLVCTSIALLLAAIIYSKQIAHSQWIFSAALPAFWVESAFYLGSLFTETREWFGRLRPARLRGLFLWVSALLPYVIFSIGAGTFERNTFYVLAGLSGVFALWFVILPRRFAYDAGFLAIGAAPFITRVFTRLYVTPDGHVQVDVLGHLMWIRVGIVALLVLREWNAGPFSLWPTLKDWRIGTAAFLAAIVPLILVGLVTRDVQYVAPHGPWWRVSALGVGYFFGTLWVVAVGEELFFRGVIERALLTQWRSAVLAVAVSAMLFGAAHLWFRSYPNWRHSAVATVLGIACGVAYWRAGSVRASMVTHAFVVTTWRMFFR